MIKFKPMKKPFKHTKVGNFLKSKVFRSIADIAIGTFAPALKIGGGVIGGAIGGVSEAIKNEKNSNLESENGGVGHVNIPRIIGYLILATLTMLVILGKIDENTFYALWEVWQQQMPQ